MGFGWFSQNWYTFLQTAGIIGSLWYAARSFRFDAKVRRVGNLFEVIDSHRKIWSRLYTKPELARIREDNPKLDTYPITREEELFVTQVILHISGVYRATKEGVISPMHGSKNDIRRFFSRPIPKKIWMDIRRFQERDFIEFIDEYLHD